MVGNRLDHIEVIVSQDLPETVVRQKMADREGLEAMVHDAVRRCVCVCVRVSDKLDKRSLLLDHSLNFLFGTAVVVWYVGQRVCPLKIA